MNWRKPAIGAGIVLVLWVGYHFGVPFAARRISFFRVSKVEIVGLRYLNENDVVAALNLSKNRSVVDNLDGVRLAASRIPGVAGASVERRPPGTLRVTVLEEVPVAVSMHNNELVLVDHLGRKLPFEPSRVKVSLPVADSGAAAAGLLARVMITDDVWYKELDSATLESGDVVLRTGTKRVRLRPDADQETLQGVFAVRKYLSESMVGWVEIDARYRGRVFVEKGAV